MQLKKIDDFKHPLTNATASDDTATLEKIRSKIKDIESEKAAIQSEMDMLRTTNIRGDVTLHDDVVEKNNHFLNLVNGIQESMTAFTNCLDGYVERFAKISKEYKALSSSPSAQKTKIGYGADMDVFERHYDPDGYEAKKRKILDEKRARAAARGGKIFEDQ